MFKRAQISAINTANTAKVKTDVMQQKSPPEHSGQNIMLLKKMSSLIKKKSKECFISGIHLFVWLFFWCPAAPEQTNTVSRIKTFSSFHANWLSSVYVKKLNEALKYIVWIFFWCPSPSSSGLRQQNSFSPYDLDNSEISDKLVYGLYYFVWVFFWCPEAPRAVWVNPVLRQKSRGSHFLDWAIEWILKVINILVWVFFWCPCKPSLLKLDGLSLKQIESSCDKMISQHFADGGNHLNEMIILVLDSRPKEIKRRDLQGLQKQLKSSISKVLKSFRDALDKLEEFQVEIKKRSKLIINVVQKHEQKLRKGKARLRGLGQQLYEDQKEADMAQQNVNKASSMVYSREKSFREAQQKLESREKSSQAANVAGTVSYVGGTVVGIAGCVGTILTGGLLAPFAVASVATATAVGGATTLIVRHTVLEKARKGAEEALRLAEDALADDKLTFRIREAELRESEKRVAEGREELKTTEIELKRLKYAEDILKTKFEELQTVYGRFMGLVNHMSSTTGRTEVLDDVLKHFHEVESVIPLLIEVAQQCNKMQVLSDLAAFSYYDEGHLKENVKALQVLRGNLAYTESVLPAHVMLKEQELMNTELLHWTPFLAGLPQLIFEVGSTVLNSNYVDFSLGKSRQKFHYLKHVESFRTNLFEVCTETTKLFNDVHTIMAKIKDFTEQISLHSSATADIITRTSDTEVIQYLPDELNILKDITDKSCLLSSDAEESIEHWIAMIGELVETCIENMSVSENERKKSIIAYKYAKETLQMRNSRKCEVIKNMERFESSYEKAAAESMTQFTSFADTYMIFDSNTTSAFKRKLDNVRKQIKEKVKSNITIFKQQKEKKDKEQDSSKILHELSISSRKYLEELNEAIISHDREDREELWEDIIRCKTKLDKNLSKIRKMKSDQNSERPLIKCIEDMIQSFIGKMTEMSEKLRIRFEKCERPELLKNIALLHSEISDFIANNFKAIENETTDDKSEHTNMMFPDGLKLLTEEHMHSEAVMTIQSYYHLQHVKERYTAKITQIREMNAENREEIAESAENEGAALSLAESVGVMANAIQGLNGIKQQWAGFLQLFQQVSNRMNFALFEGLQHFTDIAEIEADNPKRDEKDFALARKKLWQTVGPAFSLSQFLHTIADEYVKASEQYVLPSANQLTRYVLTMNANETVELRRALKKQCKESQEGLDAQLEASFKRKMLEFDEAQKRSLSYEKTPEPERTMDDWY